MTSHEAQELIQTVGNMSVGAATTGGLLAFLEQHQSLLGISVSILGLVIAAISYRANYRLRLKEYELNKRMFEEKSKLHDRAVTPDRLT